MQLKEKHEAFCQSYVIHRNATKAALAAGYSESSAHNQGYRLVHNEQIKERIKELEQGITTDVDVIAEIEKQYEAAREQGHGNTALKALELLAKVRGNNSEETELDTETLELEIVQSLQTMGLEKAFSLFELAFPEEFSSTTDTETSGNDDT